MWDQDIRMYELGSEMMDKSPEKKLRPLFTSGSEQKQTQGKSLWNMELKWKEIYNSEDDMKNIYNGWEKWITTM